SPPARSPLSALHSFPTRRSSDLFLEGRRFDLRDLNNLADEAIVVFGDEVFGSRELRIRERALDSRSLRRCSPAPQGDKKSNTTRSEEHTSELQSRSDLVCRLLLE